MISVVVPIYNTESYLRECLESLRAQTYTDFEAILVNDGSTDGSRDIALEFTADPRFRLIDQANAGPSEARNTAIEQVRGDYVFFIDSDDLVHPQAIELMMRIFDEHPEADMVVNKLAWSRRPRFSTVSKEVTLASGKDELIRTLYQADGSHNSPCARLVKLETIRKAGVFRPGSLYEDLDLSVPLYLSCNKIARSGNVLYFYRQTPGSILHTWTEQRLDVLDVVDRIRRKVADDPDLARAADSRRFSAYFNMYLLCSANGHREGRSRCWPVIKQLRGRMLADPRVRLKNKLGALVSYLGPAVTALFARK